MAGTDPGWAIQVRDLRKIYRSRGGRRPAVAGLDLTVPRGGVHGFLGPNGAGKTTTIRMLLGLIRPDGGTIRIFDHEIPSGLDRVIDRVGAIVEQPRFFPPFTGRKNLQLLARAIGAPLERVDAVLDEVGLAERGRDRFGRYSLGMKQRLAIAATLLKDPELLIFDEPTNGLDPAGIHEIRSTMRGLADRGRTVMVSSHILSEVAQIADTVSIIGRGRLLAEGSVAQLLQDGAGDGVRVGVAEPQRAAALLERAGYRVRREGGPRRADGAAASDDQGQPRRGDHDELLLVTAAGALEPSRITELLAGAGLYLHELTPVRADLETIFLELTAEEHLGAGQDGAGQHGAGQHGAGQYDAAATPGTPQPAPAPAARRAREEAR